MFNPRELATVLAALRLWRQQLEKHGIALTNRYPQFLEERPLSVTQIDRLCEQLNEPAVRHLAEHLAVDRCESAPPPNPQNLSTAILTSH